MIETEAWVLYGGDGAIDKPGQLVRESFSFPEPLDNEVLAAPLVGTWEGNMTHAVRRFPIDVCRLRMERRIVLGNAGVVRVLETGAKVTRLKAGDVCIVIPIGKSDAQGYPTEIYGYDNRGSVGLLARRTKLREDQLIPVPPESRYGIMQWAGTSIRYATAWDNWRVTLSCWKSQQTASSSARPQVWGWGGGVALAELLLAKRAGCDVAMIASTDYRLSLIASLGIQPIDRRNFLDLAYDAARFTGDTDYRNAYVRAESAFMRQVREHAHGGRVSIFIDNIGEPVWRATLKALDRCGVVTTAGWEAGTQMEYRRPSACIARQIHVHTHACSHRDGLAAIIEAETRGWLPPVGEDVYAWADVPALAADFAAGAVRGYFPVYRVDDEIPQDSRAVSEGTPTVEIGDESE